MVVNVLGLRMRGRNRGQLIWPVVDGTVEGSLESQSLWCVKGGANASRLSSEMKAGQAG